MAIYDDQTDAEKARWYSNGAKFYVEGRPRYPAPLITAAAAVAEWQPQSRILEIGSGPGTATQDFATLGGRFTCVEPNPDFVAIARDVLAPFPNITFQTSTLEQVDLAGPFDIVLAASSFHWVDQKRGVQRIEELLAPHGFVVLLWNKEPQPVAQQAKAVDEAFQRSGYPQPIERQSRDEIAQVFWGLAKPPMTPAFTERLFCHVETAEDYSVERFVALHRSLSPFLALAPEKQPEIAKALIENLSTLVGPTIRTTRISAAHIFQRSGRR
ncbi:MULTISPECIES: class I SAM-dependent methyltransferase [unclassified Rhizobium]|uniref:class I SAM-dependent methyltransferase n=1 Tax=unclassified Rhizobium TaxID=2613769 RepID=UPI001ADB318C|nr:class I SAM-dependent methyltransferase [Rhizobium sp. 16-488-2b]MBO9175469.1 class I SAM-dependent methyltransferase [Rhizobium sp. 16-488-2a]